MDERFNGTGNWPDPPPDYQDEEPYWDEPDDVEDDDLPVKPVGAEDFVDHSDFQ